MASFRASLTFCGLLLLFAAFSSFTLIRAEDSSKSEDHSSEKDTSVSDDGQDDSKEKRSREEILFGNQQNRPSGLVDDLMGMSDSEDEETESSKDEEKKKNAPQDQSAEASSSKEDSEKRTTQQEEDSNDMMMGAGTDNWYSTVPVSSAALQYLSNAPTLHTLPPAGSEYAGGLYDQEDLYRRKRQLLPLPLRRRRSLRSSLGQMIQKRGIRMPRRSMRLKRQVDMGDLISLLGSEGAYYDEQQAPPQVPGHFSSYPLTPAPEFRYPFTFQHRDDGILSSASDFDENKGENLEDNMDDIDSLMLLHPNARYVETPEMGIFPYRNRDEESEAFQKWLARHTTPNGFTVSRRSSPTFYPLDYRYIPGYKKRSMIFSHGNRMPSNGGYSGDSDDVDADLGKWGHVVQVPEAYASAEDVARLYGLANLMAEGDDEAKMRRSV